jgi:hypothetical protein
MIKKDNFCCNSTAIESIPCQNLKNMIIVLPRTNLNKAAQSPKNSRHQMEVLKENKAQQALVKYRVHQYFNKSSPMISKNKSIR